METNKYKILVLSDLKDGTTNSLQNAVSLSKIINADIEFFHVKKPTDVINRESQLSAMRTINKEHLAIDNKIKDLLEPVTKTYDTPIKSSFAFGNVKNEIRDYIKLSQPNIIVLGQRISSPFQIIGDSITQFLLKEYSGIIMISSMNKSLLPSKKMTLGVLNGTNEMLSKDLSKELVNQSTLPLKSFKIIKNKNGLSDKTIADGQKIVEYVFEKNDNTMNSLSKYLKQNNIDLLCIDRNKSATNNNQNSIELSLKEVVNKLDVSLLVSST